MKRLLLLVVLGVALLWTLLLRTETVGIAARPDLPVAAPAAEATSPRSTRPPTPAPGELPDARREVPPDTTANTGSAALELVWKDDGTPAALLQVTWWSQRGVIQLQYAFANAEGRLQLNSLPEGDYQLGGTGFSHKLTIRAGHETQERIEVRPSLRCDGIVVDDNGRGIVDAAVWVQYFANSRDLEPRLLATSGDAGHFRGATDQGGYLWAQKPGFAPSACVLQIEGKRHLRLVLGGAGTALRGNVCTATGAAAADARVTIVRTSPRDQCQAPIVLRTDAAGHFASDELAGGEHLLVAQAADHAASCLPFTMTAGQAQTLVVRLTRGATLFGRVQTSDGKPLTAALETRPAWASGQPTWSEALRPLYLLCCGRTWSDAKGNYRMTDVPTGSVTIEASSSNAVGVTRVVQLLDGEVQRCDFVLGTGGEIHGRLVDANDQPVAQWEVFASPLHGGVGRSASTDARGAFAIPGLDGDDYDVTARPNDAGPLAWVSASHVRPGSGELVLRVRHTRQDAGWFRATLLDATGAPVAPESAWVTPEGQVQGMTLTPRRDGGGDFRLGPLPPGRYRIVVSAGEQGRVLAGTHEVPARATVALGTLQIAATGTLALHFATSAGRTVTPTELSAWDQAVNGGAVFERGADDLFRSKPLPAGSYRVVAWGEDFLRFDQRVTVVAGQATLAELTVVPATPVCFELRSRDAIPGTRWTADVHLQVNDGSGRVVAAPTLPHDADGALRWSRGLAAGQYTFEARILPDGELARGHFAVADAGDTQRVEITLPPRGR